MSVKVTQTQFDQAKAEAFAGKVLTALNNGALCLMVSIGHRTGLFDIMSQSPPARSEEIATRAGLNERYVREWLGAMVTGGVVDFDPASNCYSLPEEHAAFLTRAAAADNMAVFGQYIAVMGCVEDDIVECFRKGGGVPYEKFPRFHEVMAEDSGQSVLSLLESCRVRLALVLFASPIARYQNARSRLASSPQNHIPSDNPLAVAMTSSQHFYEVRPRKDHRGVDLVSDALPFGRLWYGEPNAIASAIDYAKFRSRSHDAVIRV